MIYSKQDVHVLYGLSAGSFEQVVYGAVHNNFLAFLLDKEYTFVRVHYLFQGNRLVGYGGKRVVFVELLVQCLDGFNGLIRADGRRNKDASGEITSPRNKMHCWMIIMLQLMQGLVDLRNMLVRQCFVGLNIVGPPAEMAGGTQ